MEWRTLFLIGWLLDGLITMLQSVWFWAIASIPAYFVFEVVRADARRRKSNPSEPPAKSN
jgi:hypothetical protein